MLGVSVSAAPTALAAPPDNPKINAPLTDLKNYPKRTSITPPKPAPSSFSSATQVGADLTVTSSVKLADGMMSTTTYDPGPGISADQLATSLRAAGTSNVAVVPASAALSVQKFSTGGMSIAASGPPARTACSYGTARTFCPSSDPNRAPQIFWSNDGYSDPQVYFNDHTGNLWPTDAAVYTWNQSVGIDSFYKYNACGPAGTHCVNVFSGVYNTDWSGATNHNWDPSTGRIIGASTQLNERWARQPDGYRKTVCHELGHVLGMDHNVQDYSCMWANSTEVAHRVPDSDDFNMLATLYSIVR
ncbi:matrixin family metalloprotease [Modestobacter muralis]|uniref:Matrixin family metalloprotease n=1 Tax=Modestobacter muralis TaxID=1608614 RepID=A0A6P0EZX4_9ACTN|nr:matrixin family metalloprotease [Modestobacter muralis]NEK96480.1 matrixin family metalloprotease [Modestobacter muralis]NEN53380.1 matrixin family metalloprotease [Modestobacter muralis]